MVGNSNGLNNINFSNRYNLLSQWARDFGYGADFPWVRSRQTRFMGYLPTEGYPLVY